MGRNDVPHNLGSALVVFTGFVLVMTSSASSMQFTDITQEAGITLENQWKPDPGMFDLFPSGAVAEDFDGDGWIDLYCLGGYDASNHLYINDRLGGFRDEAADRSADLPGTEAVGAAAADYDNDGDIDICITRKVAPHVLLINDGSGHFTTDVSSLPSPPYNATSPSFGDLDGDGLLELMIGRWSEDETDNLWIYHNQGDGILAPLNVIDRGIAPTQRVFSPQFADIDNDRDMDLLVTSDFGNSRLFRQIAPLQFANITGSAGVGIDENGMGTASGDYNRDGLIDWFVSSIYSGFSLYGNRLYQNQGDGLFEDVTVSAKVAHGFWGWGAGFGDFDLDGDLDLFHVNGWPAYTGPEGEPFKDDPARLFEQLADGTFQNVAEAAGVANTGNGRAVAIADFDRDGDLDIFLTNSMHLAQGETVADATPGIPALYRNDTPTTASWLKVRLVASPPLHRHGIGSRVYLQTGTVRQMHELNANTGFLGHGTGRIAHFGMAAHETADAVRAEWLNGDSVERFAVSGRQEVLLSAVTFGMTTRRPQVGETIRCVPAEARLPYDSHQWFVDGVASELSELELSFGEVGRHEIRLDLFEEGPDEQQLVLRERQTAVIEVVDFASWHLK